MQSLGWYARRFRAMSAPELLWRIGGVLQKSTDRVLARSRQRLPSASEITNGDGLVDLICSSAMGEHLGGINAQALAKAPGEWRRDAVERGDAVADHRLALFDLDDVDLGRPINWNYEFKADKPTPMVFAPDIDYRDYGVTGDCKFAWEPSRHHQLVTLGRAFRYTGDERYAEALLHQLESWVEQCPYGIGMQWRSPLELGIRLINWVWALELIRPSAALTDKRREHIAACAYRHLWDITRRYSRFSSANNHLIGEAAGVFIGSSYFQALRGAARWRAQSREILQREISTQTYADGGSREQALGYHLFVLQFFLLAGLVARHRSDDFDAGYWSRLERMFDYTAALLDGDELSPMYGDGDDGYVLDLGVRLGDPRCLMAIGAVLFQRGDFKTLAGAGAPSLAQQGVGDGRVPGGIPEPLYWLLGEEGASRFAQIKPGPAAWESHALNKSGIYLLRHGERHDDRRLGVTFDCGELGFGAIAAHGHADALSVTLRAGGHDILVDPGTYDYFTYGPWRAYFRSTRAHNTVVVDDADQSEMLGSFMWGRRAQARCLKWEPFSGGGLVIGEHDGYHYLSDPVTHRRTVRVDGDRPELTVTDDIISRGRHDVAMHWHLGERCRVASCRENRIEVSYAGGRATIELDPLLTVSTVTGSEDPILGWVSRGYHRKVPTTVLVGRCRTEGPVTLRTRIVIRHEGSSLG